MHVSSGKRLGLLYDGKKGVWLLYRMGDVAFGGLFNASSPIMRTRRSFGPSHVFYGFKFNLHVFECFVVLLKSSPYCFLCLWSFLAICLRAELKKKKKQSPAVHWNTEGAQGSPADASRNLAQEELIKHAERQKGS